MISMRDLDAVARTVYGEARGESFEGQKAVVHVILNRVAKQTWYGLTAYEVCHKPFQFSAWNPNDPNRIKLLELTYKSETLLGCLQAVCDATKEHYRNNDSTNGSTHYVRKDINPDWAKGKTPVITIENHKFYNNID